jgi:hypothetical protein
MISSAHIFYIPAIFVVGVLAGFFMGQRSAEAAIKKRQKRAKRRKKLKEQQETGSEESQPGVDDSAEQKKSK